MRIDELRSNPDKNPKHSMLEALMKYKGQKDIYVSFTSDVGGLSHAKARKVKAYKDVPVMVKGEQKKARVYMAQGDKEERTPWYWDNEKDFAPDEVEVVRARLQNLFGGNLERNTSGSKIGINPQSTYHTPLGVYCYPIDYILEFSKKDGYLTAPFTGNDEWKYLWVIRSSLTDKQILDIPNTTDAEYEMYAGYLRTHLADRFGFDDADVAHFEKQAKLTAQPATPAGRVWNLFRLVADYLVLNEHIKGKAPIVWAALMRQAGIRLASDTNGEGLIHKNEPTQAVFFDSAAFQKIEMVPRQSIAGFERAYEALAWNDQEAKDVASTYKFDATTWYMLFLKTGNKELLSLTLDTIKKNPIVESMMVERLLHMGHFDWLKQHGYELSPAQIQYFLRSSQDGLNALKKHGYEITDDLLLTAAKSWYDETATFIMENRIKLSDKLLVQLIKTGTPEPKHDQGTYATAQLVRYAKPSVDVLDNLMRLYPRSLGSFIGSVSPKTMVTVLRRNPKLLKMMDGDETSEKLQTYIVGIDPDAIRFISKPTEAVQIAALSKNIYALRMIANKALTPKAVEYALSKKPAEAVKILVDRGEDHLVPEPFVLKAVKEDGNFVLGIQNPSLEVQKAQIKYHGVEGWTMLRHLDPSVVEDILRAKPDYFRRLAQSKKIKGWEHVDLNVLRASVEQAGSEYVSYLGLPPEMEAELLTHPDHYGYASQSAVTAILIKRCVANKDWDALKRLARNHQTLDNAMLLVDANPNLIEFIRLQRPAQIPQFVDWAVNNHLKELVELSHFEITTKIQQYYLEAYGPDHIGKIKNPSPLTVIKCMEINPEYFFLARMHNSGEEFKYSPNLIKNVNLEFYYKFIATYHNRLAHDGYALPKADIEEALKRYPT